MDGVMISKKGYRRIIDPGKIFFTSDTHFGHTNIIKYCSRPFQGGVEEMNSELISRWNGIIPEDGVIYHLGDFAFLGADKYRKLASSLHGRKILVIGNHDHRTLKRDVWSEVHSQLILRIGGLDVYLNHFPFRSRPSQRSIQLHGHIHSKSPEINLYPGQLDIGVDGHDYKPWTWEEIIKTIKL